jgi:galactose mutarotase-like enzyme
MDSDAGHCRLSSSALHLEVANLGGEMQYLRTAAGDDLLWHGDPAFWSGRAPVLFPIVGRAVDDIIATGDHQAHMPQHGFARRCDFTLEEQTGDMCRHVLTRTAGTLAVYPFEFALGITHRLDHDTLHVTAEVSNTGGTEMPFCLGFHPAFRWPLPGAEGAAHHVTLASGGNPAKVAIEDGLLCPEHLPGPFRNGDLKLHEDLFADGALVFPDAACYLRYGPRKGPALELQFDNLPDLALWQPFGAPFICIEPWHGTASYLGEGPQIAQRPNAITLAPDAVAEFGYSLRYLTGD